MVKKRNKPKSKKEREKSLRCQGLAPTTSLNLQKGETSRSRLDEKECQMNRVTDRQERSEG